MSRGFFCFFLILVACCVASGPECRKKHAITYEGGDRFGDRMLAYAQARHLSYIASVPFLYRPFIYSNQISADCEASPFDTHCNRYSHTVNITSFDTLLQFFCTIDDPKVKPTLFILHYLPSDISEWDTDSSIKLLFHTPWYETGFHAYLQQVASPRIPIPVLRREGVLNVADHVRTLSGNDTAETSSTQLPLKHPNLAYHKTQIHRLHQLNQGRPMYVFLFSDTKQPEALVQEFRKSFYNTNIEFGIQILNNPDTNYAIHDFFAMQQFDALIATQSNFSMMASRIGNFDVIITPIHVLGRYPDVHVDRVRLLSKRSNWFPYDLDIVIRDSVPQKLK